MFGALVGMIVAAVAMRIFLFGLQATRTRKLALLGFLPAGSAFSVFAWTMFDPRPELLARVAPALGAISAGLAHAVTFSLVALPPRKVWLRMVLVPLGMWTGTFTALWLVLPEQNLVLKGMILPLLGATFTSWILVPIYSKNRGFV